MLDSRYIREHPQEVKKASLDKGVTIDIDKILSLDKDYRTLSQEIQKLQEERNIAAKEKDIEKGKIIKLELDKKEKTYAALGVELRILLLSIPNPAKSDVKVGKDESENEIIRKYKKPRSFTFTPKDHLEIGEMLDIIDVKKASEVSGTRFYYLKNEGVLLEFALQQLAFSILIKEGFIPVIPPVLIKKEVMEGLGYTAMGEEENIFYLENDGLYLVGTAEQSIVPLYMNETLRKEDLPKRYVGFSSAFRREAGSYGKDTRGIFRVHQFDKVEMVSFVAEGEDDKEHEYLLSIEEKLMKLLDIPYQIVKVCSGDLGFNAARKYDIEAWIPSQQRYREMTSVSTVTDFQSRRLHMRYQDRKEKKYLYVLNGTAFSTRPLVAILENYQQKDGIVVIPEVLRTYIGRDTLKPFLSS